VRFFASSAYATAKHVPMPVSFCITTTATITAHPPASHLCCERFNLTPRQIFDYFGLPNETFFYHQNKSKAGCYAACLHARTNVHMNA
jgi:hypothetical protein